MSVSGFTFAVSKRLPRPYHRHWLFQPQLSVFFEELPFGQNVNPVTKEVKWGVILRERGLVEANSVRGIFTRKEMGR